MSSNHRQYHRDVMYKDSYTCVYCGKRSKALQLDHWLPKVLDGPDILQNLVAACPTCNQSKNGRTPDEAKMVARFGRFAYIQTFIEQEAEKLAAQKEPKTVYQYIYPTNRPATTKLTDWLWNLGVIPTKQPLDREGAWVFLLLTGLVLLSLMVSVWSVLAKSEGVIFFVISFWVLGGWLVIQSVNDTERK